MPTPRFLRFLWSAVLLAAFADAQTATSVTLTPSQNPSPFGQQVTLTAAVTAGATGKVTFYDGVNVLGTSTISGSQAALTTELLPSGTRYLRAHYLGNSSYAPSNSAVVTQTVVAQPSLGLKQPVGYSATVVPYAVAVGDFNGDGKPDIIATSQNSATANVFLGNDDGTFQSATSVNLGVAAATVVLGDFNGDGKTDLAIPAGQSVSMVVLLGNGDGTFGAPRSLAVSGAFFVVAGDFNGDGNTDLAVSNYASNSGQLTILLGNGDGTFRAPVVYAVPNEGALAMGDFNGDGNTDLIVGGSLTSGFGLLLGNGDGTFQAATTVNTPSYPYSLVVADFNGDGKTDVAVGTNQDVYVLVGNGNGTFHAPVGYQSNSYSSTIAVGDVNGDGIPDLIVASDTTGADVLYGNGDGTFQGAVSFPAPSYLALIAVGDFNGDGKTDLAVAAQYGADQVGIMLGGAIPDLSISLVHGEGFMQGQTGATYTITVTNVGQFGTIGAVGVVDTLPPGLTATAISGSGWTCVMATLACTRSDPLAVSASYPAIKITVNIASNLTGNATDMAIVSGGDDQNSSNNTATSTIFIRSVLPVSLTSSPNPSTLGQLVALTATINAAATGEVTFYDGTNILGSSAVSGGQATFTTELLPSGANNLTAEYGGNSTYGFSVSPVRVQTVNAIADNAVTIPTSYKVDTSPYFLVTADFNRDGIPDLATVNYGSSGSGSVSVLLGNGNGTFQTAVNYPGCPSPSSAAVADFNLDGKPDLVVVCSNSVNVLLGNGDGSLQSAVSVYQQAGSYVKVTVGDVNKDGIPDLILTSTYGPGAAVIFGNGDGTFQAAVVSSMSGLQASAVADVNGDGIPDVLVLIGYDPAYLETYLGNPDGTFQQPLTSAEFDAVAEPNLTLADFNGDGKLDVAVVSWSGLALLAGNGDGTFQPAVETGSATPGNFALAGDFNGDGKADVAYRGYTDNTVTLELGNGNGTFQSGATFFTDGAYGNFVLADFNADGKPDFAVVNQSPSTVNVFLGQQLPGLSVVSSHGAYFISGQTGATYQLTVSDQEFMSTSGTVTVIDTPPSGITVTGASGNGWSCSFGTTVSCTRSDALASGGSYAPIIITVNVSGSLSPTTLTNHITVSSSLGTTSINDPTLIVSPTVTSLNVTSSSSVLGQPVSMTATPTAGTTGDVLFLDGVIPLGESLMSGGQAHFTTSLLPAGGHKLRAVYAGDGTHGASSSSNVALAVNAAAESGFAAATNNSTGTTPAWLAVGDFNNDGKADMVTANSGANTVSVLLGNGDGTFHSHVDYNVGTMPVGVAVGDLNGDGKPDLAVVTQTSATLSILLGNGDGTFQPAVTYSVGNVNAQLAVAFGDFNGDGKEDVLVAVNGSYSVNVYFGNGDGTLQPAKVDSLYATTPVLIGDFNGDGKADLATGDYVYLGNGDGTFTESSSLSVYSGLAIGDLNGDGKTDIAYYGYSSTINIALGNGDGTFTSGQTYSLSFYPIALVSADVNGDGKLDVIAIGNSNAMVILYGNGDGTLQPGITYNLSFTPTQIAVGEFNGDGRTDLAFAVSSSNSVNVLLGVLTPVLSVTSSHGANFYLNETGAAYALTVTNEGPGSTSGTVTVVDTIPSGLTPTAIGGSGWSCVLGTLTCTRSDSLGVGVSYPAITINVNVSPTASSPLINLVSVSGGGSVPASAADSTIVGAIPTPTLTSPSNGATGVPLTVSLNWNPSAQATSYDVYFGSGVSPSFVTNTTATTYNPGTLFASTTYSWYVVARNASGTAPSLTWTFTTTSQGALTTGLQFYPVTPCRLVDTRGSLVGFNGIAPFNGPSIASGGTLTIPVQSAAEAAANTAPAPCGTIPSTAQAYSLNITAVPHSGGAVNYISLWPAGSTQPFVATFNDPQGQIVANAAIVPAGTPSGGISIYNAGPSAADIVIDMNGYFAATTTQGTATGLQFFPVSPCRLIDTRGSGGGFNGITPFSGPSILGGGTATFPVQSSAEATADTAPAPCGTIPSSAQAYSINTTAVPHAGGAVDYISLWPSGTTQPFVSTFNDPQGQIVANAALVPAGTPSGGVSVYNAGPAATDVVIDMNGYFGVPTGLRFYPVSPCRLVDTRGSGGGFNGIAPFSGPSIAAGGTLTIPVQSTTEASTNTAPAPCGTIPTTAQAYSLNLTVVPHAPGAVNYVSMWPAGSSQPFVATLNDPEGLIVANAAIVPAGTGSGGISVYNAGPSVTDVVIDMNGYFAP